MEAPGMIFDLLAHPGSISGGDIEPLPLTWGKRGSPFSSASSSSPLMNLGSQASSASAIPQLSPVCAQHGTLGLAELEARTLCLDSCCLSGYSSVWHLLDYEYVSKE